MPATVVYAPNGTCVISLLFALPCQFIPPGRMQYVLLIQGASITSLESRINIIRPVSVNKSLTKLVNQRRIVFGTLLSRSMRLGLFLTYREFLMKTNTVQSRDLFNFTF